MRHTGVIAWDDADIPTWAVDNTPEYLIRIKRTRDVLTTPPKEDKVQIAAVTEYIWDKNGDVSIRKITLGTGATADIIRDEDNMASDDADALCSQQSIKAYADAIGGVAFATAAVLGTL